MLFLHEPHTPHLSRRPPPLLQPLQLYRVLRNTHTLADSRQVCAQCSGLCNKQRLMSEHHDTASKLEREGRARMSTKRVASEQDANEQTCGQTGWIELRNIGSLHSTVEGTATCLLVHVRMRQSRTCGAFAVAHIPCSDERR